MQIHVLGAYTQLGVKDVVLHYGITIMILYSKERFLSSGFGFLFLFSSIDNPYHSLNEYLILLQSHILKNGIKQGISEEEFRGHWAISTPSILVSTEVKMG